MTGSKVRRLLHGSRNCLFRGRPSKCRRTTLPADYSRYDDGENTQFFDISAEERIVRFHPQLPETAIWGYRDLSPAAGPASVLGPTFSLRFGPLPREFGREKGTSGRAMVRHPNNLPADHVGFGSPHTLVHLHGAHLMPRADGFPDDLAKPPAGFPARVVSAPGEFNDHAYPLLDPGLEYDCDAGRERVDSGETPSTLWYADRFLEFTGPNVYRGLAGLFLVFDRVSPNTAKTALDIGDETRPPDRTCRSSSCRAVNSTLPAREIQDKRFAADGSAGVQLLRSPRISRGQVPGQRRDPAVPPGQAAEVPVPLFSTGRTRRSLPALPGHCHRSAAPDGHDCHRRRIDGGADSRHQQLFTRDGRARGGCRGLDDLSCRHAALHQEEPPAADPGRTTRRDRIAGPAVLKFIVDGPPTQPDVSHVPNVLRPFAPISAAELDDAYANR